MLNTIKVFYSFQSDNKRSRKIISSAIKELNQCYDFLIEKATDNESGSPHITDAILKKIDTCDVYMADISIIGKVDNKFVINNNVALEVGYAIKTLGENRIILLFDIKSGKIKDIPFNLLYIKGRRITRFSNKNELITQLPKFIKLCVEKTRIDKIRDIINTLNKISRYILIELIKNGKAYVFLNPSGQSLLINKDNESYEVKPYISYIHSPTNPIQFSSTKPGDTNPYCHYMIYQDSISQKNCFEIIAKNDLLELMLEFKEHKDNDLLEQINCDCISYVKDKIVHTYSFYSNKNIDMFIPQINKLLDKFENYLKNKIDEK